MTTLRSGKFLDIDYLKKFQESWLEISWNSTSFNTQDFGINHGNFPKDIWKAWSCNNKHTKNSHSNPDNSEIQKSNF